MASSKFLKMTLVNRTEKGATYHVTVKRNFAVWLWLWNDGMSDHNIPFYRYPQVMWLVTKAWWKIG